MLVTITQCHRYVILFEFLSCVCNKLLCQCECADCMASPGILFTYMYGTCQTAVNYCIRYSYYELCYV